MNKLFAAIPLVTFAGIGVFALTHEMFATAGLCLFAAFLSIGLIAREQ